MVWQGKQKNRMMRGKLRESNLQDNFDCFASGLDMNSFAPFDTVAPVRLQQVKDSLTLQLTHQQSPVLRLNSVLSAPDIVR